MRPMQIFRWEYKVVHLGPSSAFRSELLLNKLGAEGWSLIAFQPTSTVAFAGEGAYYLKRPVKITGDAKE